MTEQAPEPNLREQIARYAFVITLLGALILLVSAGGLFVASEESISRIMAWLALLGGVAMFGGLIVFIGYVIVSVVQRRWE